MKENKLNVIYWISSGIMSFIIANLGAIILKKFPGEPYIGILAIILAFLLLYFSFYTFQIKNNQEEIKNLEEEIKNLKLEREVENKLLNTIKDIVLLNKK